MNKSRLFNTKTNVKRFCFAKIRPPLPGGRDGLARPCRVSRPLGRSASSSYTHNDRCNRNDDPSPLHPFRVVIMSVGEEESAKLNNNKLFEHDRRANGRLFVTGGTCSCSYRCSRIMYCSLLFCLYCSALSPGARSNAQRGRPPLPVERRPSSLVCAWFNPSLLKRERVEASG